MTSFIHAFSQFQMNYVNLSCFSFYVFLSFLIIFLVLPLLRGKPIFPITLKTFDYWKTCDSGDSIET